MKLKAFRVALKFGMFLFSCWLSLWLIEEVLSVINYQPKMIWYRWVAGDKRYRQDLKRIWALKDSVLIPRTSTDKYGFRVNELQEFNPSDKRKKVFLVGDSFAYGGYVADNQTPAYYLQERFKHGIDEVTVVNAGVPGYGAGQTYLFLTEEIIPRYQPDVIIWSLNANDLWDDRKRSLHWMVNDRLINFPAWTNGIYLQGFLKEKMSRMYYESKVMNLVAFGLQEFDLVALLEPEDKQLRAKKIGLMIKKVSESGIPLLVTIAPNQEVIRFLEAPNNRQELDIENYLLLTQLSKDVEPVYDTSYRLVAMNRLSVALDSSRKVDVLGANFLSDALFLDEISEPGSEFGHRHLSTAGNKAYADLIYDHLVNNYKLD